MVEEVTGKVSMQESQNQQRADDPARVITAGLLQHVPAIVESCAATAMFVYVDAMEEMPDLSLAGKARVFCVTASSAREQQTRQGEVPCLHIPNVPLTRIGQVKIAVFLALSRGLIQHGDRIVFLSGPAAARMLDTITVIEVGCEYEIFAPGQTLRRYRPRSCPRSSSVWWISRRSLAAKGARADPLAPCLSLVIPTASFP
jgi:hypothetical protein